MLLSKRNNAPTLIGTSLVYTDHYGLSHVLNATDDGVQYQCEVVINMVMATGSITLDIMGEYMHETTSIDSTNKDIKDTFGVVCLSLIALQLIFV